MAAHAAVPCRNIGFKPGLTREQVRAKMVRYCKPQGSQGTIHRLCIPASWTGASLGVTLKKIERISLNRSKKNDVYRIAQLDGLRGFAFLLIFIVHLKLPSGFSDAHPLLECIKEFGWVGVPIFFVLSGYLITELALREGRDFSLPRFYARRALRLWPLYFTAAILAMLAWKVPFLRETQTAASPDWALPLFSFTLNFALRAQWAPLASLGFLIVFWTLAVEEQFYASWAPVLRWCSRRTILFVCLGIIVASLIARFSGQFLGFFLIYRMNTLTNFGPIMLGCTLALMGKDRFRLSSSFANAILVALIIGALIIAYLEWPFPTDTLRGGALLTAVDFCSFLLVFLALFGLGILRGFFAWRPMRALGDLSYAGYVIHLGIFYFYYGAAKSWLPIFAFDRSPAASVAQDAAILLASTLLCASCWYSLEAPFRHARVRLRSPAARRPFEASDRLGAAPQSIPESAQPGSAK